jgi:uncharacterized protein YndB with AHSA1/START domain
MTDIVINPEIGGEPGASSPSADREIVFCRLLDAPRALVWKAWTDPAHIANWWGGPDFTIAACTIQLRIGGAFRLAMQAADGAVYPCRGTFREIVPGERIVYDGEPDDRSACGAGLPPGARVTVTFEDAGRRTRLTVHTRFTTGAAKLAAHEAGYAAGWAESLERLAAHASGLDHPLGGRHG